MMAFRLYSLKMVLIKASYNLLVARYLLLL